MKVIWTEGAVEDLTAIVDHISQDSLDAARDVARAIFHGVASLASFSPLREKANKGFLPRVGLRDGVLYRGVRGA